MTPTLNNLELLLNKSNLKPRLGLTFTKQVRNPSSSPKVVKAVLVLVVFFALTIGTTGSQSYAVASPQDDQAARIFETARLAQEKEDYAFAVTSWNKLLAEHKDSELATKAAYNAGICYLNLGQFDKSIPLLKDAAPKLDAKSGLQNKAKLFLGFVQYRQGAKLNANPANKQQATELLTTATKTLEDLISTADSKFGELDQACWFQGVAYEELGRDEDALKSYTKMMGFPKPTFEFLGHSALGDITFRLGQYSESLKHYANARKFADGSEANENLDGINLAAAKALIRLADADEKADKKPEAEKQFTEAIELLKLIPAPAADSTADAKEIHEDSRYQTALCEARLGRFAESAKIYESIAANTASPLAARSLANAGRNYLNAGETIKATALLEQAISQDSPFGADIAHWLADEVYLKEETKNAQKAYDVTTTWIGKTKPEDPINTNLKFDQAIAVYMMPERRKESIALLDKIVADSPTHAVAASALYNSIWASFEFKDYKTAIAKSDAFEKAYSSSDYLADTLEVKTDACFLDGQYESAGAVFDKLVDTFGESPKVPSWKLGSGRALFFQKKHQPTIDKLTPIVDSLEDAKKAEALHWIGSSQFALKQFPESIASLSTSNQTNSKWRRADETLLMLTRAQLAGDQDEAGQKTAAGLIAGFPDSPLLADLYYYIGRSAYDDNKFDDAYLSYKQIIDNYSDSNKAPYAFYDAAWCKMEQKDFKESEKLFASLMAKFPEHELAKKSKVGRGASLRKTGDTAASLTELKEYLKNNNPTGDERAKAMFEIGLNQVELKKWDEAIGTFKMLITEDGQSPKLDRYYYELAWSYDAKGEKKKSLEYFGKIASEKPESALAGEANFHIGTAAYEAEAFDDAIKAYQTCVNSTAADHVREKAAYKLAWANYKQDKFQEAHSAFADQVEKFGEGTLKADGMFMVAESLFRLKKPAEAFEAYLACKPVVDASTTVEPKIKWLTMLHGAQSANDTKVKKYDDAIKLAAGMESSKADITFKQDAWLELGNAYHGKKQTEQAMEYFRKASKNLGRTGARAHCMIGDIHFAKKNFIDAATEFKHVYFGFGGPQSADDVKPWQAYAIYESARCSFVQVNDAPRESKQKLIAESIKQFEYLIANYPKDKLVEESKRQLVTLRKLKTN